MNKGTSQNPKYRIMLVDDSSLIRSFIKRMLDYDETIEIVAEAENGKIAIEKIKTAQPDIVLLDIEMPVMDGITALPEIIASSPDIRVIIISSLTTKNAAMSIRALANGATDYMEKPSSDTNKDLFRDTLIKKIKAIAGSINTSIFREATTIENPINDKIKATTKDHIDYVKSEELTLKGATKDPIEKKPIYLKDVAKLNKIKRKPLTGKIQALAIGCSTGGPQALLKLFKDLNDNIDGIPIFITQHMPPTFTTFLADSINNLGSLECIEGKDGMIVEPGVIYLAPGDYHMTVQKGVETNFIKLNQNEEINFCRPSVDPMLESIVKVYGGDFLTLIMTGMGSDGLDGTREAFNAGGKIIIQDEASSTVWGMPGAVAKENLYDGIFPLDDMANQIITIYNGSPHGT